MANPDRPHPNPKTLALKPFTLSAALTGEAVARAEHRGLADSAVSHGGDSFAFSDRSTASSSSSVLLFFQDLVPSCLSSKGKKKKESANGGDLLETLVPPAASWDPGLPPPLCRGGGRPLRESDFAPGQTGAQPASVAPTTPIPMEIGVAKVRKERDFVWAYKYKPRSLNEFICHREQVEELLQMVYSL